jgi:hypothetical protein
MRLKGLNFAVRMTADRTKPDFSFKFEKISATKNEVVDADPTGDLIFEFRKLFHKAKAKRKLRESDLAISKRWIEDYGFEKAIWMVHKCHELHLQGSHKDRKIHLFKGLEFYESAAEAEYEHRKDQEAGQLDLEIENERHRKWKEYEAAMLQEADAKLDLKALRAQVKELLKNELRFVSSKGLVREKVLDAEMNRLKLKEIGALTEKEFMGIDNPELLEDTLIKRHGRNPIACN